MHLALLTRCMNFDKLTEKFMAMKVDDESVESATTPTLRMIQYTRHVNIFVNPRPSRWSDAVRRCCTVADQALRMLP